MRAPRPDVFHLRTGSHRDSNGHRAGLGRSGKSAWETGHYGSSSGPPGLRSPPAAELARRAIGQPSSRGKEGAHSASPAPAQHPHARAGIARRARALSPAGAVRVYASYRTIDGLGAPWRRRGWRFAAPPRERAQRRAGAGQLTSAVLLCGRSTARARDSGSALCFFDAGAAAASVGPRGRGWAERRDFWWAGRGEDGTYGDRPRGRRQGKCWTRVQMGGSMGVVALGTLSGTAQPQRRGGSRRVTECGGRSAGQQRAGRGPAAETRRRGETQVGFRVGLRLSRVAARVRSRSTAGSFCSGRGPPCSSGALARLLLLEAASDGGPGGGKAGGGPRRWALDRLPQTRDV